mmetsp:Transcript_10732/g.26445  ORF Transcript_10732/g.26445 Transcript_10732/m.26445 type:complete len:231 (+) Transcript_10732:1468-2160(+)
MARSTLAWPGRRASASKRCGRSVSRLMLSALSPASLSAGRARASAMPLDVMASVRRPGRADSWLHSCTRSGRSVGSPPVSRTLVTPACTNRRARRRISGVVSRCEAGVRDTPSAGMQYVQRRLHLSVRLMRRYVCTRLNVSVSIAEPALSCCSARALASISLQSSSEFLGLASTGPDALGLDVNMGIESRSSFLLVFDACDAAALVAVDICAPLVLGWLWELPEQLLTYR